MADEVRGTVVRVLAVTALLAWCASFVIWGSGGLEPSSSAFFVLASMKSLLGFRTGGDTRQPFGASCLIAVAMLTWPETVLVAFASAGLTREAWQLLHGGR
ncbi:MAG: hypothetical protein JSV44_04060 [Candidatus Zixiibacteriota bacterium]|nr:MAG: hypothetical protein JSV44_04060 [candidate division Zixibacteria bacterium]